MHLSYSAQEYLNDIKEYYDKDGFVKNSPSDSGVDGNAWIYTAIDIITQADLGVLTEERANWFFESLLEHKYRSGMWWRAGKIGDDQNHDDIIAIVTCLLVLANNTPDTVTRAILRNIAKMPAVAGDRPMFLKWFYHYKRDGIKQWFSNWWWPIFGVVDYFKCARDGEMSLFSWVRLMLGVWSTSLKPINNTSGRQLDWLVSRGLMEMDIGHSIVDSFEKKIKSDYPPSGRMGLVFGTYYRNINHPFARAYASKVFL